MKNNFLLFLMIFSFHSMAETKWVKTPFWRAPQLTELSDTLNTLKLTELESACGTYQQLIASVQGQTQNPNLARKVDRWRKIPLITAPMNVNSFEAYFQFSKLPAGEKFIEQKVDLTSSAPIDNAKELLPHYTQHIAFTGLVISEITDFDVRTMPDKTSLAKFSQIIGLPQSKMTLEDNSRGILNLKIEGLDVACDLIARNITLWTLAPAFVRLPEHKTKELEVFYHQELSPELNRILSKNEPNTLKAARLGYQMSRILEENLGHRDSEAIETNIKGLMDTLFLPKSLDQSPNLIEISKKKVVNLVSLYDGDPVRLTLLVE